MAWTTPRTWVAGELVTASMLNVHLRDNLNYLYGAISVSKLGSGSGTSTAAGATNVGTVSVTGLGSLDTLLFYFDLGSATQDTADPLLYNSTDGVTIQSLRGAALAAGTTLSGEVRIRQDQSGVTTINSVKDAFLLSGTRLDGANQAVFTQFWTGTFGVSLRHGGVTAGGTFRYSWALYRIVG